MEFKGKVMAIDLDNTLTTKTCWTEEDCQNAEPNIKMVEIVQELFKKNTIIIYTARKDELLPATVKWLRAHDIPHFGVCNEKRPYDVYVDDKAINTEDFEELF